MKIAKEYANEFLQKYNCSKGGFNKAFRNSINASIQHNRIYSRNISSKEKRIIKMSWQKLLDEYVSHIKYERPSIENWSKLILDYQKQLNAISTKAKFKISHCQKSLSLYLKYVWIFNDLKNSFEPPVCVIDSTILKVLQIKSKCWTKLTSIEEYEVVLKSISSQLAGKSLAHWELQVFGDLLRKKSKNKNNISSC